MSQSLSPEQHEQLRGLIQALHEERITPEESARLEQWICQNEEARWVYVRYMNLVALLHWDRSEEFEPERVAPKSAKETTPSPIVDILGDIFQVGVNFFSRSFVWTLLLTVGLPGILLYMLVLSMSQQSSPEMPVATVTRTHECIWSEDSSFWRPGADLYANQRLELHKGLVEITFARGAKVLLEGPATFTVAGGGLGFLRDGSLVAMVEKGAEGFAIRTPALSIVDLGTEFGVRVVDEKGTGDVEVFHGKVELRAKAKDDPKNTMRQYLTMGQAARVEVSAADAALPTVRQVAPAVSKFVRQMPVSGVIVANFSGGAGNTRSDQFPGTAGSGWATGWNVGAHGNSKELSCVAAIDESSPLLGGGEYLRVLAERKAGNTDPDEWAAIDRRLAVTDVVDLTKPHVVTFNLRIDSLASFTKAGDRLSICTRNVELSRFVLPGSMSSGWHICMVGQGGTSQKLARSRNWYFLHRDEKGRSFGVDSGITPSEGSTYSFRIVVDPPARRWTPSIAVDGGKWTEYEALGMRSKGTAEKNGYWPYLNLFWQLQGSEKEGDVERIGFSVDSIRITPR